ncbi:MAG TPA: GDP-L-fucose synthase, partial [Rhodobacterales bacterium]|nr:GDP-L-fucose synthase [Rhodobacterales bacterium]
TDISILELAELVARITGYKGRIATDPTKPDGTPRKLMDVTRLANIGWRAKISHDNGIAETYRWFLENIDAYRR